MKNLYRYIIVIGLILIIISSHVVAQKAKKKTTRISVEYYKDPNNVETLVAKLRVKEKKYLPLKDVLVHFYSLNDTSKVLLSKIRTNKEGKAIFTIRENSKIFKDSLGIMSFEVEYVGTNTVKSYTKKIHVKQADLEASFFQKDTLKFIELEVTTRDLKNQIVPISNLAIRFYIKGTFSLYNFAKEKTDESGKIKIEFPVEMPGDTLGVLTIVAKIVEDDMYGTVETRGKINWGVPVPLVKESKRGLGDTDAPLWMVYTLIILLSAVWFHYLYVIFMIVKIKLAKETA